MSGEGTHFGEKAQLDMDPSSAHDPDVYATVESEQRAAHEQQARVDALIWGLLETDALTAREPHDGIYTVHEDDLEYLVRTILALGTAPEERRPEGGA